MGVGEVLTLLIDGMLLPPLHTQDGYVELATKAGFTVLSGPKDISQDVAKTW